MEHTQSLEEIARLEIDRMTPEQIDKIKYSTKKDLKIFPKTAYGRYLKNQYLSDKAFVQDLELKDISSPMHPKNLTKDLVHVIWENLNSK